MSAGTCSDDRLVRARRGELAADEQRDLHRHLETCALCRASVALGRAVGPLPAVDAEDQAMAERLVARQLELGAPAARPSRLVALPLRARPWGASRAVAVAASILLMATVASAAYWTVHRQQSRRAASDPAAVPTTTRAAPRRARTATPDFVPRPAPPTASVAMDTSIVPPQPVSQSAQPREVRVGSLDPETLLREANEARRARRNDQAVRGYRALQTRFPSSKEAVLSHLSLGNLYLTRGASAEALEQFQAYLRVDGAELAEEALLGEARALAALGRADDERTVWRTLEARFPTSEYLWRARQRLRELDAGGTP